METNIYNVAGVSRKHSVEPVGLSVGGRVVYRRTRWSPALGNTLAALAGIGPQEVR